MKILIITGGNSSERKISLISAKAVKEALEKNKHTVKVFDLRKGLDQLNKILKNFDAIFPVLHGEEGEGGALQKYLTKRRVKFVGGDYKGFNQGFYKIPFKKFCDQNKILTADWKVIKKPQDILAFGLPCVVKNSKGGSSREVIILTNEKSLTDKNLIRLLNLDDQIFVEKFLEGIEITVGVLDGKALPILEIIPPQGKWFDYKNKYSGETKEIPNAPSLTEKQRKESQKIAEKIHKTLNLGHYSRTDFIVSKGKIYALEVNTIPGLTPNSLMPKAAKAAGLDFNQFIQKLISLA